MKTTLTFAGWFALTAATCGLSWCLAKVFWKAAKWLESKGVRESRAFIAPVLVFLCLMYAALFTWVYPHLNQK